MKRTTLHDGWRLTVEGDGVPGDLAGRTVPAAVPGSSHLDLLAAGLIPDPYLDLNETALRWTHRAHWRYTTTFEAEPVAPGERVDLVFDGLDTVVEVLLNGDPAARSVNMHRSVRVDLRGRLAPAAAGGRPGTNDLVVALGSALEYAEGIEKELGARPRAYPHPFNAVRKMACSFGWDWGPDLQTAGIWKPVRLERWHTARIASLRPLVSVAPDGTGRVDVHVDIERGDPTGPRELVLTARVGDHERRLVVPADADTASVRVEVPEARLWWPAGYGDHPLYDLEVVLGEPGRTARLDAAHRRVGFRTVTVDTTPDEHGTPFTVAVNGVPVFVKGANWIPDDHFLTRVTRERLAHRVDQALGAHMNMLRVWGGGIYETDDFYDVCDERGMLVWQDFPFACAAYAEEEPLWSEVEAEARENVARLSSHPSLALWNGANENMWGFRDWGWREELGDRSWGLRYYTELLPAVVRELDPTRFYAENSPCNPGRPIDGTHGIHPNDQDHGTRHEWEVWNRIDQTAYRDHVPRFCSEFGFQGPPTWTTLRRAVRDEPPGPTSPAFLLHQKAEDGNGKLERGLAPRLPVPRDFVDWHWATQLNQARAVALGVEHFRSWWPRTAGSLVWQLNDCWPVTSWAAVDGDGRPKPLWYGLRRAHAPRLLTVQPRDGRPTLIAINDTDRRWTGSLTARRIDFPTGAERGAGTVELEVPARSVRQYHLADSLITPDAAQEELLVMTAEDGTRVVHPFLEDLDLALDPDPLEARAVVEPGGYRVEVRALALARDVALLADRAAPDAEVDDMLVTLLPGETRIFRVRTDAGIDPTVLTRRPVLRTANDLFRDRSGSGDRT
ncbi:glycoside hydrolase family 2 protein [Streptomyces alkaliphilus]|uniref:beta-mannosidase n=1 Tax=Streptomyces alkaliphilus TaxID=1472722 RepID=A0A7W3TDD9_9ACTN|nr:glycoside hydrolase family 2 protein [Streptomyces alkaliphilus]MBB0244703.1 glycoside hydrolase family 2 protein [Streptomyces alkaliphilus]